MGMIDQQYRRATRQMRWFILIWTFVTLVMGLATFMGIYFTLRPTGGNDNNDGRLLAQGQNAGAVVLASQTPLPITPTVIPPTATVPPTALPTTIPPTQAAVLPTDAPAPTPVPPTPTTLPALETRFEVGVQVQVSPDFNQEFTEGYYSEVANKLHVRWIKHRVGWDTTEPNRDEYLWLAHDIAVNAAKKHGLKIMFAVVATPDWAREPGVDLSRHGPPANNADFTDFLNKLITRYKGDVHAVEVWNEPNIDREWTSVKGLSATNFTALLRDAYTTIKAIDPGIIVISGAPSPTGWDDGIGAFDDFRWTDMLIAAGALNYMDCFGAHHNGYNLSPLIRYDQGFQDNTAQFRGPFDNPHHSWSFRSTLEGYNARIRRAGKTTPLCVTEFGWAVAEDVGGYPRGFEFAQDNTLAEQEKWFPEALQFMEESGFVRIAYIWNFNYGLLAGFNKDNDNVPYSLWGPNGYRPAFNSIAAWLQDFNQRTGQ
jgi:hypothetical protein